MERLTEEKQIGPFAALKDKAEAVPGAFGSYDCLYAHMVAVTRLKEYEDIGLEPEEVTELMAAHGTAILALSEYRSIGPAKHFLELAQAEKDGRLVVLEPNDPLTLEELREMDGDKIYIHYINGFYTDEDGAYFGKFEQLVRECNGKLTACELPLKYYGKSWLAYRRRPEEGQDETTGML